MHIMLFSIHVPLIRHNQMALIVPQSFKNLPANGTEMSTLRELLDGDLEFRSIILRREGELRSRSSYAEKAAGVFAECLKKAIAVKEAYVASIQTTKALKEALTNALNVNDSDMEVLATIPSTKGILTAWTEIKTLTGDMLARLEMAATEVETHLHLAAGEQAAQESAHVAASDSLLSCADSLHVVNRSIDEKRRALFGLRRLPSEILLQIFREAVDARQCEIIKSLSSYKDPGRVHPNLDTLLTTVNLVPFILSATCMRWRVICQTTPQLWRYALVPMIVSVHTGNKAIGKAQFERCILLAQDQPLELTVYPCYNVIYHLTHGATYPNLVLTTESQVLRVNIVWYNNYGIPRGVPSPVELYIVASANSSGHYMQTLPPELLVNTKKLQCIDITPWFSNQPAGIQSLHIVLSKSGPFPLFNGLLENCPQLQELYLQINATQSISPSSAFTHQQLHTLSLTGLALPWVISAFSAGCCLPHLAHLVLTNINGFSPILNISETNGQLSHVTHIEVLGVSAPGVVTHFLSLFKAATALRTITLSGSAVVPVLKLLASPPPTRVEDIILHNSDADGTTLQDYFLAIKGHDGGISEVKVVWNNCPNFASKYGRVSGEIHL